MTRGYSISLLLWSITRYLSITSCTSLSMNDGYLVGAIVMPAYSMEETMTGRWTPFTTIFSISVSIDDLPRKNGDVHSKLLNYHRVAAKKWKLESDGSWTHRGATVIHTWALYGPMVMFSIRMDRWQPLKVPQKKTLRDPDVPLAPLCATSSSSKLVTFWGSNRKNLHMTSHSLWQWMTPLANWKIAS
jgi:hypothetical protein